MTDRYSTDLVGAAYYSRTELAFDPGPNDERPSRDECADLAVAEPRVFPRCPATAATMGFAWRCVLPECADGCVGR